MNSQGWIRGLIAKNYNNEKFVSFVVKVLGMEFELSSSVTWREDGRALIKLGSYQALVSSVTLEELQSHGAYTLDRFLLEVFEEQGLSYAVDRSQYIRYCMEEFTDDERASIT
ncbi:hypothetical protein ACLIBG_09065 [Virgibacillus sp. W0181]|uniref:hypothetical protein n=1 Tax=Virgibacillus sp. W0181 TaxID=3391581 RepID=UPI003F450B91